MCMVLSMKQGGQLGRLDVGRRILGSGHTASGLLSAELACLRHTTSDLLSAELACLRHTTSGLLSAELGCMRHTATGAAVSKAC